MKKIPPLLFSISLFVDMVLGLEASTLVYAFEGSLQDSSFYSPNLSQEMPYRIYLPPDYSDAETESTRYPVLYLLHGHEDEENYLAHTYWTERTQIATLADSYGMIIVFPEGLRSWYTNYYNSEPGMNRFEDYIIHDVIDHVDETYRTRPDRESRAIMGNSMGGNGALKLAARHSDRFCAAASMSGVLDLSIIGVASFLEPVFPNNLRTVFGPYPANLLYYEGNSAAALAPNFVNREAPGRSHTLIHFDAGLFDHYFAQVWALEYARVLDDLGLAYDADIFGGDSESAGHTWTYWGNHIEEVLEFISKAFKTPPARPRRWCYRTVEPSFEVWGWSARILRSPRWVWVEMVDVDKHGFDFKDDGTTSALSVETPLLYVPGASFKIVVSDSFGETLSETRGTADSRGSLQFEVDFAGARLDRSAKDEDLIVQDPTSEGPQKGRPSVAPGEEFQGYRNAEKNWVRTVHVQILEEAVPEGGASSCGGCAYAPAGRSSDSACSTAQLLADLAPFLMPVGWLAILLRRHRQARHSICKKA